MDIERLGNDKVGEFIVYCRKYGPIHDDSYIMNDDLNEKDFIPDRDNPTYIAIDENNRIIGTASLMTNGFKDYKRARFRIFHSIYKDKHIYGDLLNSILTEINGIDDIYMFLPESEANTGDILNELGFEIQRYSYLLRRDEKKFMKADFPDGLKIIPFRLNKDEKVWCSIINTCFEKLAGHIDMEPELIYQYMISENYINGGLMLLWDGENPVGCLHVSKEVEGGIAMASIDQLAVLPEYQGKNIGRNLLRTGIEFGKNAELPITNLSVNAENSKAANLYLSEGFKKKVVMVCYNKKLKVIIES